MRKIAAMSIPIGPVDQTAFTEFWENYGADGRAIIAQPVWKRGKWTLKLGMLDEEAAEAVAEVLDKCKELSE